MLYWPRAAQRDESAANGAFSMKQHAFFVGLAVVVVLLLAACGGGGTATLASNDVAVVGDQQVTKDDLTNLMDRAKKSYAAERRPFPKPGTSAYNTLQGQAVTFLLQRAQFAQKAADMGIHISDKQVDDRIEQLKKQFYNGSEKTYEQNLAKQGLTPDQARGEVKAQLISEALYNKITSKVNVSDSAVQSYYNANKAAYQQKASRDVRHILVSSKALADQLYARLVAAHEQNFAALAKQYSKDPGSASKGGKLTITKGQTVPAFDKTAFALKKGQLSHPVHTQYGWHIIQALSAVKPPAVTPLNSQIKASIRQQLEQQQKNDAMTKWVDGVKKDYCKGGTVKYAPGYAPNPDPCLAVTGATSTTSTK
jgi:parvulin-like peptidyl-prolyl isomerase